MAALPLNPPIIVHHMAAFSGQYPPNSLEAIRQCLEANAPFIEVDITALKQDDYLLVHDTELDTETSGSGLVSEALPQQVHELWLKWHRTDKVSEVHPALLSDVVSLFGQFPNATRLQLDFKNVIPFQNDEPLQRLIRLIEPLGDRVIVSSGADWQLRRIRKLASWLDLGFDIQFYMDWRQPGKAPDPRVPPFKQGIYGYWDDHPLATQRLWPAAAYLMDRCETLACILPGISTFYIDHNLLVKSLDDGFNWAQTLHTYDIKLDAWTLDADNPEAVVHAKRLLDAGVDQFTTNTPSALAKLLHT